MFLIILAFWWSTSGQFVSRAGQLFIFDLKFGISGSAYPIFYVKVTLFRDKNYFWPSCGRPVVIKWTGVVDYVLFDQIFRCSWLKYTIFLVKVTFLRALVHFWPFVVDQWSPSVQGWSICNF